MRFRNSRLRIKISALLLSLAALWAFAAWVTVREGVNLVWVATLDEHVSQPVDDLLPALQKERRLTVVHIASENRQGSALAAQRAATDAQGERLRKSSADTLAQWAASDDLKKHLAETFRQLSGLKTIRQQVDAKQIDRDGALQAYSDVIDSLFRLYDSLATLDDKDFAADTRALIQVNRAREVLAKEDARIAGALTLRRVNSIDYGNIVQDVGAHRHEVAAALVQLRNADAIAHQQLTRSESRVRVRILEDQIITQGRNSDGTVVSYNEWTDAVGPALQEMYDAVYGAGDRLVERATPIAAGVIAQLALAGGLGLIAVIASIVVSITTARAIVNQLAKLRAAAYKLAYERLPSVVERLGRGEHVDVEAEAPPLEFGDDEIGQVGQVFNTVQETAIRVAVEQAELRRGIRDVLLSLARRTQVLVHQQLTLLDAMERRETTTEELEDLFRIDHLATRMRRNAENLIVLSGATPARGWRRSMPMIDVVRGAVGEVEDYTRVNVQPVGSVSLAGRAVGDVTHLLAELIENAVSFSPPYTTVQVSGHMVANGYAIEVEDRGLGMSDEKLAAANERIVSPKEINLSSDTRLGLYVVSRLASRYGINVSLKRSSYGGTTAVVLIPRELVTEGEESSSTPQRVGTGAAAAVGRGRGDSGRPGRPGASQSLATSASAQQVATGGGEGAASEAAPEPAAPGTPRMGLVSIGTNGVGDRGAERPETATGRHSTVPDLPLSDLPTPGRSDRSTPAPSAPNSPVPNSPAPNSSAPQQSGPAQSPPAQGSQDATTPSGLPRRMGPAGTSGRRAPGDPSGPGTPTTPAGPGATGGRGAAGASRGPEGSAGGPGAAPAVAAPRGTGPTGTQGAGPEGTVPEEAAAQATSAQETTAQGTGPHEAMPSHTPSGLPLRVPQRNMAAPLRGTGESRGKHARPEEADPGRSPEEVRRLLGSYQRGTQRGRSDAEASFGAEAGAEPREEPEPRREPETGTEANTGMEPHVTSTEGHDGSADQASGIGHDAAPGTPAPWSADDDEPQG